MGYVGKLKEKLKAIELRGRGFSVKAIERKLRVSRSTVSLWVRDVQLTERQLRKLYLNKKTGSLRGSIVAALNKKRVREELTRKITLKAIKEVGFLSNRDKFIAGVAMYLGEGDKSGGSVGFSNSDPRAIAFMMKWFRKFCKVPQDKFRLSIYLHDNLDENKARDYWSKLTSIPLSNFRKSYIVKNNPKRLRKVKHIFGVLRISISDINLLRRILGWISKVFML